MLYDGHSPITDEYVDPMIQIFSGKEIAVKIGSPREVIFKTPIVVYAMDDKFLNSCYDSIMLKVSLVKFSLEGYSKGIHPVGLANLFEKYRCTFFRFLPSGSSC